MSVAVASLVVKETFDSIQGEGFHAGTPAFFIRLAGCHVGCPIRKVCDTDFENGAPRAVEDLVAEANKARPEIVIVTGGEPLEQAEALKPLLDGLHRVGSRVHLETSGRLPIGTLAFDWVTCSPKATLAELALTFANEVKVVYGPSMWTDEELCRFVAHGFARHFFLQPLWGKLPPAADWPSYWLEPYGTGMTNARETVEAVKRLGHPWRLGLQLHKFAGAR